VSVTASSTPASRSPPVMGVHRTTGDGANPPVPLPATIDDRA
jgi:hypothetical protein